MSKVRARGEDVRKFILEKVEKSPSDIAKITAEHFQISRQAANNHLKKLTQEGILAEDGKTRSRIYKLCPLLEWREAYKINDDLQEDVIWRDKIAPVLGTMPENVKNIWSYGFTEIFNNAIDHSDSSDVVVFIKKTALNTEIAILDHGVGIFKKIQKELNLLDERHAILELSKGKLTTDPSRHSGEGIFFSSRMFDEFNILSGGIFFAHEFNSPEDWILEQKETQEGTVVWMVLNNHTSRTVKKVFDKFSSGEDYGFNKTVVPVKLAQYGNDSLISRSQAKRLLARVELFKTVVFDFTDVDTVGQAFADEIFRVFARQHPEVEFLITNAKAEVKKMIDRAKSSTPN